MVAKRTIAIDIDDVIADSTEALRLSVNERHDAHLTKEHYRVKGSHERYYEYVWEQHGLGQVASFEDFNKVMQFDQTHIPLVEGAYDAISKLKEKFHVIFITARPVSWDMATRAWFESHFGEDMELFFSQGYFNEGDKTKGQLCKEFGASLLIDDVPANCQSALDEGVEVILFGEYGWHGETPNGAKQCKNWSEVVELLVHA